MAIYTHTLHSHLTLTFTFTLTSHLSDPHFPSSTAPIPLSSSSSPPRKRPVSQDHLTTPITPPIHVTPTHRQPTTHHNPPFHQTLNQYPMARTYHPSYTPMASPASTPPPLTRRTARHRATSIASIASSAYSPATPQAVYTPSGASDANDQEQGKEQEQKKEKKIVVKANLPSHYTLPPTVPSPFTGKLDAALDAILSFNQKYTHVRGVQAVTDALLREVNPKTNWAELLLGISDQPAGTTRILWTELLFLVSRTLLPELIAENRAYLFRLYERRKQLAMRLVLRYDMLRAWTTSGLRDGAITVASVPPARHKVSSVLGNVGVAVGVVEAGGENGGEVQDRRALMPNVIPTLIAAPAQGYSTHGVRAVSYTHL